MKLSFEEAKEALKREIIQTVYLAEIRLKKKDLFKLLDNRYNVPISKKIKRNYFVECADGVEEIPDFLLSLNYIECILENGVDVFKEYYTQEQLIKYRKSNDICINGIESSLKMLYQLFDNDKDSTELIINYEKAREADKADRNFNIIAELEDLYCDGHNIKNDKIINKYLEKRKKDICALFDTDTDVKELTSYLVLFSKVNTDFDSNLYKADAQGSFIADILCSNYYMNDLFCKYNINNKWVFNEDNVTKIANEVLDNLLYTNLYNEIVRRKVFSEPELEKSMIVRQAVIHNLRYFIFNFINAFRMELAMLLIDELLNKEGESYTYSNIKQFLQIEQLQRERKEFKITQEMEKKILKI